MVPSEIKPLMTSPREIQLTWEGLPGVDYNVRFWKLGENKQNLTVSNRSSVVIPLQANSGGTMMWNIQVSWFVVAAGTAGRWIEIRGGRF